MLVSQQPWGKPTRHESENLKKHFDRAHCNAFLRRKQGEKFRWKRFDESF